MDTYIINGVEVQYDTFDLTNLELYGAEAERLHAKAEAANAVSKSGAPYADQIAALRELCEDLLDSFDCLLGEGMAERIFGGRMNVMDITQAYKQFIDDVNARVRTMQPASAGNREQRRAAERARRREEAAKRAAKRAAGDAE